MLEREEIADSQGKEKTEKALSQLDWISESAAKNESETEDERKELTSDLDALNQLGDDSLNRIRQELIQAKLRANDIHIPPELDDHVQKGLLKGIKAQKAWQFRKWSTLAACFLLIAVITTARVSPAAAAVLRQIPGLGYIVELINYDKGLQSAVDNDFILPLGVADEQENIRFTVDGVIMDEASLVIFYTVENKKGYGNVDFSEVKLTDEMGVPLEQVSISHSRMGYPDEDSSSKIQSRINVNFYDNTLIPDQLHLEVKLLEITSDAPVRPHSNLSSTWKVIISVDKEKFADMKRVYEVNQSVVIEGQKITFEKVTVYPTRMVLDVVYDPANSKKIFYFDDLRLVNEKGEEWEGISNGASGSRPDDDHGSLFFQSNYFSQPNKLYLRGKSIRALDKENTKVTVDLENKKILVGPPNLVLDHVLKNPLENEMELFFSLKTDSIYDEKRGFSIFSYAFTDALGNSFDSISQGTSNHSDKPGYGNDLIITLPDSQDQPYQSPITFQIQDYPSRITGKFNIRIK